MSTGEGARQGIAQSLQPYNGKMAHAVFMSAGVRIVFSFFFILHLALSLFSSVSQLHEIECSWRTHHLLYLSSLSALSLIVWSCVVLSQGSTPGFFLEQSDEVLIQSMNIDYWTACFTAKASALLMAKQQPFSPTMSKSQPPKLIFVASTLGYMSFAGYSSYSPAKHAIRGLADTLRSELLLYGIDVHCFFPAGILSPGFELENQVKPELTKIIEGSDVPGTPEMVAAALLKGLSILSVFQDEACCWKTVPLDPPPFPWFWLIGFSLVM